MHADACIFFYKNINMFPFSGFKKLTFTLLKRENQILRPL